MRYRVVVSPEAEGDVARLQGFLLEASPDSWPATAEAVAAGIESLAEFPDRGRPMSRMERRELFIPFGRAGYVLQYRVAGGFVLVARIFHNLEDRPLA